MKKNEYWAVQKYSRVWILLHKLKYSLYNLKNLQDLAFLWITKLIFRCVTMVSENCFTSVLHVIDQLLAPVNRLFQPRMI